MEHASDRDMFTLTEPSTPTTFYTSVDGGLSLTNAIEEDEGEEMIHRSFTSTTKPYSHSREEILSGATPRRRSSPGTIRLSNHSVIDKRKATPYSSIGVPGEQKKKRTNPMSSLASIMDPDVGKFEASMKTCQKYLEHCNQHLPNILSTPEYDELMHRIDINSANKYSSYLVSLRDNLSKEKCDTLIELINESIKNTHDGEDSLAIGDPGLDPKQSIHIIPELATKEKRMTIPRQDGKPGPSDDPEQHWGHEYWKNVVSREKAAGKDIVVSFIRLASGRMGRLMNDLVDNSEQVQIDRDIEAQRREQKAVLNMLSTRLQSLLSQYEKATETEVAISTTQMTIGSRTVVGEQAQKILQEFETLAPGRVSVRDVVLMKSLRETGVLLEQLYERVFTAVQNEVGASLSDPREADVSYDTVQLWLNAIIDELIVRSLGKSPGSGLRPPTDLRVDPSMETPTSGVIESPVGAFGMTIDTSSILNDMTVPFQVLIDRVKKGLRYVAGLDDDYSVGISIAEVLSEYEDAARKVLVEIGQDKDPDRQDLDEYIRYIKISIYLVYGVFLNNAKPEIIKKLPLDDANAFSSALERFIQQISDASLRPVDNIEDVSLEDGKTILFGRSGATESKIVSGLKVYNKLTESADTYVFIYGDEFHMPSKSFEKTIEDLIERSIDLFEQFGRDIDTIAIRNQVESNKREEDDEKRLGKLYVQLTKLYPRLVSVVELQPREAERERLQESILQIRNRMDVLDVAINNVLDRIARIRPKYRHTAEHAAKIQHSGVVIPSATLDFANTKAFTVVKEKLPDVARAGIARLQSDIEVVAHYVDLVCGIILESQTDFGRQWTQKERMEKSVKIQADGFLGLAKHSWTGRQWIYGEDILKRRKHEPGLSTRVGGLGLSFPMPMFTIVRPKGPGFY